MEGVGTLRLPEGCKCESSIAQHFDYYGPINVESVQQSFEEIKVTPSNGMSVEPYEFEFETPDNSFLLMNSLYLYCRARIVRANGSPVDMTNGPTADKVAPVNNLLMSMWKTIKTKVNDVTLNPSSAEHIPYKSMIETVLSVEGSDKNYTGGSLFFMDEAGKFNDMTVTPHSNAGFRARRDRSNQKGSFDMCGQITNDFLRSDNHLAPGNKLSLTFERSPDHFSLMTAGKEKFKIEIDELAVYGRRVKLFPEALRTVLGAKKEMERYLSSYTEIKEFPLQASKLDWSVRLYSGVLPKQVIIGMVSTKAKAGSYDTNPFLFDHFNIKRLNLKINGTRYPQEAYELDFEHNHFLREYINVFMNTGKYRINSGNCITPAHFAKGVTLFPFDLTPDQCDLFHTHAGRMGTLEIEMEWLKPLPEAVTVIAYSVFDQVVTINGETIQPETSLF